LPKAKYYAINKKPNYFSKGNKSMIEVLIIHSKTPSAIKIVEELKSHLAALRRQKNLVFTEFIESEDGKNLGFYRHDLVLTATIRLVAVDKDLMADDVFVEQCMPSLLTGFEGQLTVPFLIGPVANPELIPIFQKWYNALKSQYMIVNTDSDMVQLSQAIRTVVEKM
jgi:hypothetical protein